MNSVWVGFWASKVNEIDTMNERDTVNERDTEIHCFWQKRRGTKMKSPKKKTERRFGERQGVRRSIVEVQPTTITKKNCCKKDSLLWWSYKHRYSSHIVAYFFTPAIVFAQNDVFIAAGF